MDKRLLGIFLAIPSLLVISAMVFWVASHPGEDAEFERISALPILENNKYSFKLQREKADAIETFAKSFPNSPKTDLLIRYFFDISHSYGLPTARDRGSDLIFAVQLRPYASDPTIDESINNSYAVEKFHQSDPFYEEVKLSAEKLITMPDQNISTAEKAVRFCGASDEQAWQERIVDLAWQVASGKKDQDGLTLLSNSIKKRGTQLGINGHLWPSGKPFSTNDLNQPTLVMVLPNSQQELSSYLQAGSFPYMVLLPSAHTTHRRLFCVSKPMLDNLAIAKELASKNIEVLVSPDSSKTDLINESYRSATYEFDESGKLVRLLNLAAIRSK